MPSKNILDFTNTMKIFFPEKSKIGHGGPPRNWIPQGTTLTEYLKTFLVFYKWPDLTDVQGIVHSTVEDVAATIFGIVDDG